MNVAVHNIQKVKMPRRQLACVNHTGPYQNNPTLFEHLFNHVLAWVAPQGYHQIAGMEAISVYHDDPESVPPEKQRISVGFTVPVGTVGEDDIVMLDLPAGWYVKGTFEIGPTAYGEAWKEVFDYIQEQGLVPADGPMYESYRNDPHQHPEGKHLVDICVAIQV
jgi:AraC family transcriptional regulator